MEDIESQDLQESFSDDEIQLLNKIYIKLQKVLKKDDLNMLDNILNNVGININMFKEIEELDNNYDSTVKEEDKKEVEYEMYNGKKIEINDDYKKAFKIIDKNENIFITGEAGTGKSQFLKILKNRLRKQNKRYVVLAPTGVAALNVNGETIHSFFKFSIHNIRPHIIEKKKELFKNLDCVIIDEVSMLRADLMDHIDEALQINKGNSKLFGGCQMIFIGDLSQLPPVTMKEELPLFTVIYKTPYFLSARCIEIQKLKMVKFNKIYRQNDTRFIEMLNQVRRGQVTYDTINTLNTRCGYLDENNILVTTTNKVVKNHNNKMINKLPGEEKHFKAECENISYDELDKYGIEKEIIIKNGCKIMFLNNNYEQDWVNGSLGKITYIGNNELKAELENGRHVTINRVENDINSYKWDEENKEISVEKQASIIQFPIKLAYASTIHKCQGMTFDKINLDLSFGTFAPGQLYVALSRATSLEGITLIRPIRPKDIILDGRIDDLIKNTCEVI